MKRNNNFQLSHDVENKSPIFFWFCVHLVTWQRFPDYTRISTCCQSNQSYPRVAPQDSPVSGKISFPFGAEIFLFFIRETS